MRPRQQRGELSSPVTGGGVTVNHFEQFFLLSLQEGKSKPEEWAQSVWETIAAQGQRLIKDGKTLETAQANLAELTEQAQAFERKLLPVLRAVGVV